MQLNFEVNELRLGRFLRFSWRRGRGGSGPWMALAIVATTMRFLRYVSKRKPRVVHKQQLLPGQSVRVDHLQRKQSGSR